MKDLLPSSFPQSWTGESFRFVFVLTGGIVICYLSFFCFHGFALLLAIEKTDFIFYTSAHIEVLSRKSSLESLAGIGI